LFVGKCRRDHVGFSFFFVGAEFLRSGPGTSGAPTSFSNLGRAPPASPFDRYDEAPRRPVTKPAAPQGGSAPPRRRRRGRSEKRLTASPRGHLAALALRALEAGYTERPVSSGRRLTKGRRDSDGAAFSWRTLVAPPVALLHKLRSLADAWGVEQCLRGFEVGGGEPLGEAGVDRGQEVARRRPPSLALP